MAIEPSQGLRERWQPFITGAKDRTPVDQTRDDYHQLVQETLDAIEVNFDQAVAADPIAETETAINNILGMLEAVMLLWTVAALGFHFVEDSSERIEPR